MGFSLRELADLVGGVVEGDPERIVERIRSLETAGSEDLAPYSRPGFHDRAAASGAGALLVDSRTRDVDRDRIVVESPGPALARLLAHFHPAGAPQAGIHPTAVVGEGCNLGDGVRIGAQAVLGDGTELGDRVHLHPLAVVGPGCRVGADSILHPHSVLYAGTVLGERVTVHAGAVLGSDGFRYEYEAGVHLKVPQVGRLVVEDDVEIGANTTVDRGGLDETRIGAGSKLDNLVQVGHNVSLGRACVLVSQVGLAGSTVLGDGVVMGGQSGAADHLEIGDGAQVAARAGVTRRIPAGARVAGLPAENARDWWRREARVSRLGKLQDRVRRLERSLEGLADKIENPTE